MHQSLMGPALCLLSAAGFGAMAIFGRLAYAQGVPTKALLVIRFTLATVCVGLLLATRRARRASLESNRLALGRGVVVTALALSAAVCYSMQASLYLEALHHMDAALLALIFYTYPTFVMLAAIALRQDHFTRGRAAALVVASVGMLLVLQSSGSTGFTRLASSWPSALTYTVYILVSDTIVDRMPALPLCALVMAGAATALAVQALLTGSVEVSFGFWGWLWVVCIALVSTVLAMAFFFAGLRRTGPSTAAILSTFEPVVTTALAGLVLSQIPTFGQVLGGLLVLVSVLLVQDRGRAEPEATSQAPAAQSSGH